MSDKFLKEFGTIKIDNVNLVRLPSINLTDEEKTVIKKSVTNNERSSLLFRNLDSLIIFYWFGE
jgi:hypothetical protein